MTYQTDQNLYLSISSLERSLTPFAHVGWDIARQLRLQTHINSKEQLQRYRLRFNISQELTDSISLVTAYDLILAAKALNSEEFQKEFGNRFDFVR